jgi:polysaccharide export outer membrane protein
MRQTCTAIFVAAFVAACSGAASAQSIPDPLQQPAAAASNRPTGGVVLPPDYVIGPEDQLSIVFWREKDLSADVVVRPDGRISLPLLNDIPASGLTPDELREQVQTLASRYVADPNATVIVKEIRSRKLFITGQIAKPGVYPMAAPTTVLQLIALAGGLNEFADSERIIVWRTDAAGHQVSYLFNYKAVAGRRNLQQNISLKPGDTVVVP